MKYHTIIRNRIRMFHENIEQAKAAQEDLMLALELVPQSQIYIDYEVNVNWTAKSMDEVKDLLKKFAKKGIMLDHLVKSDTNPAWLLKGKNVAIRLAPYWRSTEEEGATCRLVKVGETTEVRPIYKLVCEDQEHDTAE